MGNVIRENFEFSISLTLCASKLRRGVQSICSVFGSFFIFMNLTRGNFCKKTNSAYDKKVIISVPPAQCTRSPAHLHLIYALSVFNLVLHSQQ